MSTTVTTTMAQTTERSGLKQLLDDGKLSRREFRLLAALMVISAIPEASKLDKVETAQLLDKVIRCANDALNMEVRIFEGSQQQPG